MKNRRILYLFLGSLFLIGFSAGIPSAAQAHPGNTDASGCHTCRTNCPDWGLSYGEYHCHNSRGTSQPQTPIRSTWGANGSGYTQPWPSYGTGSSLFSQPSCPLNSYYDGISSCKCNYGYVVSNGSCVSGDSVCRSDIGLMSRYDSLSKTCKCMAGYKIGTSGQCEYESPFKSNYSHMPSYGLGANTCPANSIQSLTDPDSCSCKPGYQTNKSKDACVKKTRSSYDKQCRSEFGSKSKWNGEKEASDGSVTCSCKSGYAWNTSATKCVKKGKS